MARTITEIYDSIVNQVNNDTNLPNASTSMVAKWRLLAAIVAAAIYVHEVLWDTFSAEVENYILNNIPGTVPWYHEQALKFQYGDSLQYVNSRFVYDPVDTTHQIIKRVAVNEVGGQVRIKISKEVSGVPCELSSTEKDAFSTYINKVKFAGTNIAVINYPPDTLKLTLDVVYDALVMKPDGSLISDNSLFPVTDAIEAYIAGIVYGGVFNKTHLVDAIQAAAGVIDPMIVLAEGKADNASTYTTITQNYTFVSGYAVIDTLTVNYIANV